LNKVSNPYAIGTANSSLFRIPALYTLKSGRILACSDIRYGNGTDDPANIETALRYSDDNGATWSPVLFVNHFDDMEDCDHDDAIPTSASFVDSAIVEGNDNQVFHMCDACPAYMGLWSKGTYGKGNGFIDGKLALCDNATPHKAASTTLDKDHYPYYADDFAEDGFAPVKKFSDNTVYNNYYIDRAYNLYDNKNGEYVPVMIKQMKKDGSLSDIDVQANTFYAYSPIKMYPTYYLWAKISSDGGETWGNGTILNLQINSRGFSANSANTLL
jgi:sialidase-1